MRRWLLVGALLAASPATVLPSARAGILSVSGQVEVIAPPSSVVSGALTSNTLVRVFQEQQGFTLPAALEVDFTEPGLYDSSAKDFPPPSPLLAAGTRVDVYFFHTNPADGQRPYNGSVTFSTDILGVIIFNPDSNQKLKETDVLFGLPTTTYPAAGLETRDLELDGSDEVTLSADRRTLSFHFSTLPGPMDQIRVITAESFDVAAVPEPASLSLALLGLFVGAGVGWRRRRRAP